MLVATQWRVASHMAGITYLGLDYGAATALAGASRFKSKAQDWRDLRLIEVAVREVLNGN